MLPYHIPKAGGNTVDWLQRYELIRPILLKEKTVSQIHSESGISTRTLLRYLLRYRETNGKLESLADQSRAPHSNPNWFTPQDKDAVINYKLQHPHLSARQIAQDLTESGVLKINYHSVASILKAHRISTPFFSISRPN